jgi:hypothetical protein
LGEAAGGLVSTRQIILAALVIAVTCCAVMWFLEGFRQERMVAEFRAVLDGLPTAQGGGEA